MATRFHHLFELETDNFNSVAPRPDAINDMIGGDELALWLHDRLLAKGYACLDIRTEDHGWDFEVTRDGRCYLVVSSCDFEEEGVPAKWHSVQVAQIKGEPVEPDPVLEDVRGILAASDGIDIIADEAKRRR